MGNARPAGSRANSLHGKNEPIVQELRDGWERGVSIYGPRCHARVILFCGASSRLLRPLNFNDLRVSIRAVGRVRFSWRGSDPLEGASLWPQVYHSQSTRKSMLIFRGENNAGTQNVARGLVKPDCDKAAILVEHPDRHARRPDCPILNLKRDAVKRPLRLVRP